MGGSVGSTGLVGVGVEVGLVRCDDAGVGCAFDGEAMATAPCVPLGEAAPLGDADAVEVVWTDFCGPM
jgi:hypothetical protein